MAGELRGMLGFAVSLEITRRSQSEDWRLDQLARDERREARVPEADGEVDAFRYQIADMFAGHELDREFGIAFAEDAEPAGQYQRQQEWSNVDPEEAAAGRDRAGGDDRRVLDGVEVRLHLLVEAPSLVGQGDRSRGAIQQPHAKPGLQPADRTAHAGIGEPDQLRGLHEAAAINNRGEDAHSGQDPSIERHPLTPDI